MGAGVIPDGAKLRSGIGELQRWSLERTDSGFGYAAPE